MSKLPAVSPGEIIASEHINDIMEQSVNRYASVADRTASNPTPEAGEMAYMAAEGNNPERVAFFDGTNWLELADARGPGQLIQSNMQEGVSITVTTGVTVALSYTVTGLTIGSPVLVVADGWGRSNTTPTGASWYIQTRINSNPTLGAFITGTTTGAQETNSDIHMLEVTPDSSSFVVDLRTQILAGSPSTFFGSLRVQVFQA